MKGSEVNMGGFFGAVSHGDALTDVFFGTDYHSHLGTEEEDWRHMTPKRGYKERYII